MSFANFWFQGRTYFGNFGNVGDKKIWEDDKVKLLGVTIDNKLKFDYIMYLTYV